MTVSKCEGFATPDMNGVLTLHLRAGPGRASSRSVPFSDTPNFSDCFELTLSIQQTLNALQVFHMLKYSPLQFIVVHRRIDGSSVIFG